MMVNRWRVATCLHYPYACRMNSGDSIETGRGWQVIRQNMQPYPESLVEQERLVAAILTGESPQTLIFTEHPPIYTIGTSGSEADVLLREIDGEPIEVFESGRGGEVTYHGPGQLVVYVLADLRAEQDLHKHVWRLEEMVIRMLAGLEVAASRNSRGIGVWVADKKIAAVGVRCRKWVVYHGIALNIAPNMHHFDGIITCGMRDRPVTSMQKLGLNMVRNEVEKRLLFEAGKLFYASFKSAS